MRGSGFVGSDEEMRCNEMRKVLCEETGPSRYEEEISNGL